MLFWRRHPWSIFSADYKQTLNRFSANSQQILSWCQEQSTSFMNNPRPHHNVQFRAVQSPQWAVKLRTKKTGSAYPQNRKKLPKVRRHDISPVSRILSLTSNVFFFSLFWLSVFLPACTYIQWVVWGMEWHQVKKKAEKLSFKSSKKKFKTTTTCRL